MLATCLSKPDTVNFVDRSVWRHQRGANEWRNWRPISGRQQLVTWPRPDQPEARLIGAARSKSLRTGGIILSRTRIRRNQICQFALAQTVRISCLFPGFGLMSVHVSILFTNHICDIWNALPESAVEALSEKKNLSDLWIWFFDNSVKFILRFLFPVSADLCAYFKFTVHMICSFLF